MGRAKKPARKARKVIHPNAVHDEPRVACKFKMGNSGRTAAAVNLDIHRSTGNMLTVCTSVAEKPSPLVMLAEMDAGSVEEHGKAPMDDVRASELECMTADIDDAEADDEADDEAEAGVAFATKSQETNADDHRQPQDWCADAERVSQQFVLNLEQEPQIQG